MERAAGLVRHLQERVARAIHGSRSFKCRRRLHAGEHPPDPSGVRCSPARIERLCLKCSWSFAGSAGCMGRNKSSISKAESYRGIGEFWDSHDLTEHWEQTEPVEFEFEGVSEATYFPVETTLSAKLVSIAEQRGVS